MLDWVAARKRKNNHPFYLWPQSGTLTFDIGTWFFNSTVWPKMINISARLLQSPLMHTCIRVTERKQKRAGKNKKANKKGDNYNNIFQDYSIICTILNTKGHNLTPERSSFLKICRFCSFELFDSFPGSFSIFLHSRAHALHKNSIMQNSPWIKYARLLTNTFAIVYFKITLLIKEHSWFPQS